MNILLEGIDNSGKSTLARVLSRVIGWEIVSSEGPEKWPGEINERCARYAQFDKVIFDRHPCVSEVIYGFARGKTNLNPKWINRFYSSQPLMVYCSPPEDRGLKGHVEKDHDSPEHLKLIADKALFITQNYDLWALKNAHVVYRWGRSQSMTVAMVRGAIL